MACESCMLLQDVPLAPLLLPCRCFPLSHSDLETDNHCFSAPFIVRLRRSRAGITRHMVSRTEDRRPLAPQPQAPQGGPHKVDPKGTAAISGNRASARAHTPPTTQPHDCGQPSRGSVNAATHLWSSMTWFACGQKAAQSCIGATAVDGVSAAARQGFCLLPRCKTEDKIISSRLFVCVCGADIREREFTPWLCLET